MKTCFVPGVYTHMHVRPMQYIEYSLYILNYFVGDSEYTSGYVTFLFSLFQSRLPHLLHEEESPERFRRSGEAHFPFWLVKDGDFSSFCL